MYFFIGFEETLLILTILILLFGPEKIPNLAKDLGKSIRYIKNIINKIKNNLK